MISEGHIAAGSPVTTSQDKRGHRQLKALLAREWHPRSPRTSVHRRLRRRAGHLSPKGPNAKESLMYEKPVVQRLGSLRELTLGLGPNLGGDPASVYHRS